MQTVVETPSFVRQAELVFTPAEKAGVIDLLAFNPMGGDEIPGTSGVRKLRVPALGKGKRGGARVIYYVFSQDARSTRCWPMRRTAGRTFRLMNRRR